MPESRLQKTRAAYRPPCREHWASAGDPAYVCDRCGQTVEPRPSLASPIWVLDQDSQPRYPEYVELVNDAGESFFDRR